MTENEKEIWISGDDGIRPYLRAKGNGMPRGKINQIAWLLLCGSGCGFCKVCRDEPCNIKDGEKCTINIANYIKKIALEECENETMQYEAMEKQRAKKPHIWGDGYADGKLVYDMYDCPNCGESYEIDYADYNYCPNCGQRIDRTDLERMEG